MNLVAVGPRTPSSAHSLLSLELNRRATMVMARARLHSELRAIVLDVLGLREPGELPNDMAVWVDHEAENVVSAVCDKSMKALLDSIEATIAQAAPPVVARLAQVATRHDAGLDQ